MKKKKTVVQTSDTSISRRQIILDGLRHEMSPQEIVVLLEKSGFPAVKAQAIYSVRNEVKRAKEKMAAAVPSKKVVKRPAAKKAVSTKTAATTSAKKSRATKVSLKKPVVGTSAEGVEVGIHRVIKYFRGQVAGLDTEIKEIKAKLLERTELQGLINAAIDFLLEEEE